MGSGVIGDTGKIRAVIGSGVREGRKTTGTIGEIAKPEKFGKGCTRREVGCDIRAGIINATHEVLDLIPCVCFRHQKSAEEAVFVSIAA